MRMILNNYCMDIQWFENINDLRGTLSQQGTEKSTNRVS